MLPERSRQMYSVYAGGLRERVERVRPPKFVVDSFSYALEPHRGRAAEAHPGTFRQIGQESEYGTLYRRRREVVVERELRPQLEHEPCRRGAKCVAKAIKCREGVGGGLEHDRVHRDRKASAAGTRDAVREDLPCWVEHQRRGTAVLPRGAVRLVVPPVESAAEPG